MSGAGFFLLLFGVHSCQVGLCEIRCRVPSQLGPTPGLDPLVIISHCLPVSHPDSLSDLKGGSEISPGCETIYWDSLPVFFFLKAELVPVVI